MVLLNHVNKGFITIVLAKFIPVLKSKPILFIEEAFSHRFQMPNKKFNQCLFNLIKRIFLAIELTQNS